MIASTFHMFCCLCIIYGPCCRASIVYIAWYAHVADIQAGDKK